MSSKSHRLKFKGQQQPDKKKKKKKKKDKDKSKDSEAEGDKPGTEQDEIAQMNALRANLGMAPLKQ